MSEKSQLILMAEYNQLMNQRIINASETLSSDSLTANKGAFFKSVIGTLNHIMIGDILWLKRFYLHHPDFDSLKPLSKIESPKQLDAILFNDLISYKDERVMLDKIIIDWCKEIKESDLNKPLKYQNMKSETHNKRLGDLILHVFLHQIHHRGQITTLLSQENVNFGETDLPEIIPEIRF